MEKVKNKDLLVDISDSGIMHLSLNRPNSLNAFSPDMMNGLKDALREAKQNKSVRVVVISGSGKSFSAGGDVKIMGEANAMETYEHIGKLNEVILAMQDLEKPIIAAVHGFAAGAGFNLALASDMILASEGSQFVLSFSKVGLISDGGGHYFLPRIVGAYRAKELLFSAEPIGAEEAHELGIVNHVYLEEEFKKRVKQFSEKIASGPAVAYGFMKKIVDQSYELSLDEVLERERITQATVVSTDDHKEGVQAFKEKREPVFGQSEK